MLVETYEVEKIDQNEMQALAADGEAALLIEQLGLDGQKSLMSPETKELIPYRVMTKEEHIVFSALFTQRCKVEDYKAGPIPLRVLQVAAHARSLTFPGFGYLEVWYPKQGLDDPFLVARQSSYQDPVYMLARWGDSLLAFAELQAKAEMLLIDKARSGLLAAKNEIEGLLGDVTAYVKGCFANGEAPTPHFYK